MPVFQCPQTRASTVVFSADFSNSFKRRYGDSVPRFFYGSLGEALREGMKQCKPVIVYLNNDNKMETNIFCAEVRVMPDGSSWGGGGTSCHRSTPPSYHPASITAND